MDDERTADEILAAADPGALFGEAAQDLSALKRSYAGLARRFRPAAHPEVFAHVQSLYRDARAVLERRAEEGPDAASPGQDPATVPPEADGVSTPTPVAVSARQPADDPLPAALARAGTVGRDDPVAFLRAVGSALWRRSWHAPIAPLEETLDALSDATIDGPPGLIDEVVRDASLMLAWSHANADPEVPRPFLAGVAQAWGRPAPDALRALAAHPLPEGVQAEEALESHLEQHHPGLLAMWADIEARIEGTADRNTLPDDPARPVADPAQEARLVQAVRGLEVLGRGPGWFLKAQAYVVGFVLAFAMLLDDGSVGPVGAACLSVGVGWLTGRAFVRLVKDSGGSLSSRWYWLPVDTRVQAALDVAKELGWTPLELVHAGLALEYRGTTTQLRRASEKVDLLLWIERRRFALWSHGSEALIARWDERVARFRAAQESEGT